MALIGGLVATAAVLVLLVLSVVAAMPWLGVGVPGNPPVVIHVAVPAPLPGATAVPVPTVPTAANDAIATMLNAAMSWLGVPYRWGGCSRSGIDCSCFVQTALSVIGIHAPRVTTDQIRWATPISASEAKPGDLVFFDNTCTGCGGNPTHVGLYLGNGQVINAGDPVQIDPLSHFARNNPRFGRAPAL